MSQLIDLFLEYVKIHTTSDESSDTFPSAKRQFDLARLLTAQLQSMPQVTAVLDEAYGYVYATLPSNLPENHTVPAIGFLAYTDPFSAFFHVTTIAARI